jgi:hypothetical protein
MTLRHSQVELNDRRPTPVARTIDPSAAGDPAKSRQPRVVLPEDARGPIGVGSSRPTELSDVTRTAERVFAIVGQHSPVARQRAPGACHSVPC